MGQSELAGSWAPGREQAVRKPLYPRGRVSLLRRLNREPGLVDKVSSGNLLKLYAKKSSNLAPMGFSFACRLKQIQK